MSASPPSSYPTVRFTKLQTQANTSGAILLPLQAFTNSFAIIEGIDLVDNSLSVNDQAQVYIVDPGSGQPNTTLFQAFTYATSQGYFAWRGSFVLFPNLELNWNALLGNWSVSVWGHVEPAFQLSP